MSKPFAGSLALACLAASFAAQAGNQPVRVDSKEYKVLLAPGQFAGNPQSAADALLQALRNRLAQLAFDKTIAGSFAAGDRDQLAYYDVPGQCTLDASGYSARVRQGDHDDIEFKYRHPDEELADFTDVSGSGKNPSSKLETDVSPGSLVYAHSTKQDLAAVPATISALINQFPGAGSLSAYAAQTLAPVGGIAVTQQEYDGPSADLGQSGADFSLTLWYVNGASAPALAELSFRVDADSDAYFTTPVMQRSQVLLKAIGSLSGWELMPSTTKTAWLYGYKSAAYPNGFCSG